jgi:hypothetical protein
MTMKLLLLSCLAIAASLFVVPRPAVAASLTINDALASENIAFSVGQFEGGFTLDGTQVQIGLGSATVTVAETTAAGAPIIHTFSGDWITGGLVPSSGVIAFAEPGVPTAQGVSDILTFSYTTGPLGGHLTGTFESDSASLLPLPAGATVVAEGAAFVFNNGNITASAISDVADVPEPSALALFGTVLAILGFAFLRRPRTIPN